MTTKLFCNDKVKVTIYPEITWKGESRRERQYWKYRLHWNNQLVFKGNDFSSPMFWKSPVKAIYSLLGFLTLQPGDTDSDYFDNYTELQRDWMYSNDCEELRLVLYDLENSD